VSIYATLWTIRLEKPGPPVLLLRPGDSLPEAEWVEVFAQGVPAHIGQPTEGYECDPYRAFLPPLVVPYDPEDPEPPYRGVVIVQRGRHRKEGQRYIDPVLVMSGEEYRQTPFPDLLQRIYQGIDDRLTVDTQAD
jgi:hypothetical protein